MNVEVVSMIFGGISAILGVFPYFRKAQTYRDIGDNIKQVEFPEGSEAYSNFTQYLDFSKQVLPFIYNKIRYRFYLVLVYVFSTSIIVGIDFKSGDICPNISSSIEWWDIIIGFTNILIGLTVRTNIFLDKNERTFFRNYHFICHKFYTDIVVPKIEDFNSSIDRYYKKAKEKEVGITINEIGDFLKNFNFVSNSKINKEE